MTDVTIYTRDGCGYCARAKSVLAAKKASFTEINAGYSAELKSEMIERSGRATFPQIFIGGIHVGGCDDLLELDAGGKLDELLAPAKVN